MFRVLLGLSVAASFLAGRTPAVWTPDPEPAHEIRPIPGPSLDIYGNQVERALGGYRIDLRGDVYEEHNPDTAVSKLGSPAS